MESNTFIISEKLVSDNAQEKWTQIANQLSRMNRYQKGEAMEERIKDQLEEHGFTVTKTQSITKNGKIIGDNGIDHLAQIKIDNQIIRLVIQSKNWKNKITGSVVRDLSGVITDQYPGRIGLIITNNGGINLRARNLIKNSTNTILVYDFNELKYLKNDLKNLQKKLPQASIYEEEFGITINKKESTETIEKRRRYIPY